jgi:hypothetical protein
LFHIGTSGGVYFEGFRIRVLYCQATNLLTGLCTSSGKSGGQNHFNRLSSHSGGCGGGSAESLAAGFTMLFSVLTA